MELQRGGCLGKYNNSDPLLFVKNLSYPDINSVSSVFQVLFKLFFQHFMVFKYLCLGFLEYFLNQIIHIFFLFLSVIFPFLTKLNSFSGWYFWFLYFVRCFCSLEMCFSIIYFCVYSSFLIVLCMINLTIVLFFSFFIFE